MINDLIEKKPIDIELDSIVLDSGDQEKVKSTWIFNLKMCELTLYQENIADISEIVRICKQQPQIKKGAVVLHDKDVKRDKKTGEIIPRKPHYHLMLDFGEIYDTRLLIGVFPGLKENTINMISGEGRDAIAYLTHELVPRKYLYSRSDVCSNFDINPIVDEKITMQESKKLLAKRG